MAKIVVSGNRGHVVIVDRSRNVATVRRSTQIARVAASGPQGPAGVPGPSGAGYTHTQAVASDTWTIAHNLGYRPSVELIDDAGNEFAAEVQHPTVNLTTVNIAVPVAGIARLN